LVDSRWCVALIISELKVVAKILFHQEICSLA
jgi:hypothetical protein